MLEGFASMVTALTGFCGLVAGGLLVWRRVRHLIQPRIAARDIVQNSALHNELAELLDVWRDQYSAMRTLCVCAKNCGSGWDVEKPVELYVVAESHADRVQRVFSRWSGREADPPHRRLLNDVVACFAQNRVVHLMTEDMPDSELRDFYAADGVVSSIVFPIAITGDKALIYGAINFGRPLRKPGDEHSEKVVAEAKAQAAELAENRDAQRVLVYEGAAIWQRAARAVPVLSALSAE